MRSIAEIDRDHEGMGNACVNHSFGCTYPACDCDRAKRVVPNVRGVGPKRIQLSRAKGWRMPPNTVKVDRTTRWGNPFKPTDIYMTGPKQGQQCGVAGAVQAFRNALENDLRRQKDGHVSKALAVLRGKNLACWCKPGEPCHADVLLELANASALPGTSNDQPKENNRG